MFFEIQLVSLAARARERASILVMRRTFYASRDWVCFQART